MRRNKWYGSILIITMVLIVGTLLYLFKPMTMKDIYDEQKFSGRVERVDDNAILVAVDKKEEAFKSSDLISVSLEVKLKDSMTHFEVGDKVSVYYDGMIEESYPARVQGVYAILLTERGEASQQVEEQIDLPPMVKINGKLYYDTGKISDIEARCGVMDGEITSAVDPTQIPTKDNQSNFGEGYGYQLVDEKSIDIYINKQWMRFELRKE